MRQALVPVVAWSLATGAAVTLSWWGVHSVMAGTAYDPPRAVPITAAGTTPALASAPPLIPATQRPESPSAPPPSPRSKASGTPPAPHPPGAGAASPSRRPALSPPVSPSSSDPSGTLKNYEITGGRAVFSVGATSASLVSATPAAGWQMQAWTQPEWVRVTFTKGQQESSVFYTWNGHAPMAEFDSR
ncbi:hypothetical protein [Streptomyces sp. NBC_01497]|uniref:hypothetical protein n=1 Tax=Streptomyces sp. NBC_01497 TaxID=2903885 RepID=UPI002E2FA244|nr:hypothetical protein [Streptomyces sp. NBC_01497]